MEIFNSIGERLRTVRESMDKTQSDFAAIAAAADVPGATRQSQAKYEKGLATPSATYLAAIAAAGADVLYILSGKRNQTHVMAAISRAGGRVRLVRGTRSPEEFAALLGVTPAFLEKVEAADQWINNDLLTRIVEHENVSPMWLLSGEIPPLEGELNPLEVILIDHYRKSGFAQQAILRGQAGLLRAQSSIAAQTHAPAVPTIDLVADYKGNQKPKGKAKP